MYKIAVIEDDPPVRTKLASLLRSAIPDCLVYEFSELDQASVQLEAANFDLVVSDIDLGKPGEKYAGVKVAKILAGKTPLLIVSGMPSPDIHRNVMLALEAWDYLEKPIDEVDFINQVRHALDWGAQRKEKLANLNTGTNAVLRTGNIEIDPWNRPRVKWKGQAVNITLTGMNILKCLVEKNGATVLFSDLFDLIPTGRNKNNLRVHVKTIKDAFLVVDENFDCIKNVPMAGYAWKS